RRVEGRVGTRVRARGEPRRQGGDLAALRLARVHHGDAGGGGVAAVALLGGLHPRRYLSVRLPREGKAGGGRGVKAVVMAGGEGTRLRPLTSNQPKPMVPIRGKTWMEDI